MKSEKLLTRFKDVNLYVGFTDEEKVNNYEYLFNLTNSTGGDAPANSLFNINTLKSLYNIKFVDIVADPTMDDIDLTDYTDLATTLGLSVE